MSRRGFDDQPLAGAVDVSSTAEQVRAGDSELVQAVLYRSWPVAGLTCGRRRSGKIQRRFRPTFMSGAGGGSGGSEHPARCPDGGSRIGDSDSGLGAGVAGVVVEGNRGVDLATQGGAVGARGVPDV
jgi:hypothetical protein